MRRDDSSQDVTAEQDEGALQRPFFIYMFGHNCISYTKLSTISICNKVIILIFLQHLLCLVVLIVLSVPKCIHFS